MVVGGAGIGDGQGGGGVVGGPGGISEKHVKEMLKNFKNEMKPMINDIAERISEAKTSKHRFYTE